MGAPPTLFAVIATPRDAAVLAPVVATLARTHSVDARAMVAAAALSACRPILSLFDLDAEPIIGDANAATELDAQLAAFGALAARHSPSRIVVHGTSIVSLAAALTGYARRIPISHIDTGGAEDTSARPGDQDVKRRIISTIAEQHLVSSSEAAAALYREGADPQGVRIVANTAVETLFAAIARIDDGAATHGLDLLFSRFRQRRLVLATPPATAHLGRLSTLVDALDAVARLPDVAIIFTAPPPPTGAALIERKLKGRENIAVIPPQDHLHLVRLLGRCDLVITADREVADMARPLGKGVVNVDDCSRSFGARSSGLALVDASAEHVAREAAHRLAAPSTHTAPPPMPLPSHALARLIAQGCGSDRRFGENGMDGAVARLVLPAALS